MQKILLVEDDPSLLTTYQSLLACEGYETVVAVDGRAGVDAALEDKFDLIVTDNRMPRLSGTELIVELREHGINTPIIMCSADPIQSCAVPLIRKPFDVDHFLQMIRKTLEAALVVSLFFSWAKPELHEKTNQDYGYYIETA